MKKFIFLFSLFAGMGSIVLPVMADEKIDRINRIKAAFILNIARYVEWPKQTKNIDDKIFMLCFLKKNPLGTAIKSIHKKRIGTRNLEYQSLNSLAKVKHCDLLFLTQAQLSDIAAISQEKKPSKVKQQHALRFDKNVLTMGDLSDQSINTEKVDGVLIYLIRQTTRIGIEINMASLNKSQLKLSSELLKLSKRN